jgi:predicted SAM-dependent methyltransferase
MNYNVTLKNLAWFEFYSWYGRNFINSKPSLKANRNKTILNLGCGENIIDGYINADFYNSLNFFRKSNKRLQWCLDLRFPLECPDNTFDGVYTEHTLEHLYPHEVKNLLSELFRVMKKGSIIRISVPDINKYVKFYNDNNSVEIEFKNSFSSGCDAIRNVTQNYFHHSVWNISEMSKFLVDAGFMDINESAFNNSVDSSLNIDLKDREWESLYIEARK